MKKLDWILIFSLLIIVALLFAVCWFVSDEAEFRIVMGVVLFLIWLVFVLVVIMYRLLPKRGRETLEIKLSRLGFNIQKCYQYSNDVGISVTLYIDFDSKQIAGNVFYNNVIPFSRLASGRVEIVAYGINTNKSIVHYVISIRRKGSDNQYDYIEIFNTIVENSDLSDNEEITEQMLAKYPLLKDILDLDGDVQRIVSINEADGFVTNEVADGEWEKYSDSDEIDYDPSENSDPNYTKPPFSDKRW